MHVLILFLFFRNLVSQHPGFLQSFRCRTPGADMVEKLYSDCSFSLLQWDVAGS